MGFPLFNSFLIFRMESHEIMERLQQIQLKALKCLLTERYLMEITAYFKLEVQFSGFPRLHKEAELLLLST